MNEVLSQATTIDVTVMVLAAYDDDSASQRYWLISLFVYSHLSRLQKVTRVNARAQTGRLFRRVSISQGTE